MLNILSTRVLVAVRAFEPAVEATPEVLFDVFAVLKVNVDVVEGVPGLFGYGELPQAC